MQNLWKQVADQYCTSAEEVQAEIAEAIRQGKALHQLEQTPDAIGVIPPADEPSASDETHPDEPQPEDVVAWIAAQLLTAGILPSAAVSEQPEMAVKR